MGMARVRENRIPMRLEGDACDRGRWQDRAGARALKITAPIAAEPGDADVRASRVHQPRRWQRAGGDERGEEEREAQAPVHDRSMTRPAPVRSFGYPDPERAIQCAGLPASDRRRAESSAPEPADEGDEPIDHRRGRRGRIVADGVELAVAEEQPLDLGFVERPRAAPAPSGSPACGRTRCRRRPACPRTARAASGP